MKVPIFRPIPLPGEIATKLEPSSALEVTDAKSGWRPGQVIDPTHPGGFAVQLGHCFR